MSTRCNILVKDRYQKQWFYRHSDGYPSCTAESLKTFIRWMVDGLIRKEVSQGSSWLIVLGNTEYAKDDLCSGREPSGGLSGWKVGAYEVTDGKHGDIAYLYTIDLQKETVKVERIYGDKISNTYSFADFLEHDFEGEDF